MATPTKPTTREPAFLVPLDDIAEPEPEDRFVEGVTDGIVELVQAERARQGLPPLTD